jgi:long-chain acyl-CoA synthetase
MITHRNFVSFIASSDYFFNIFSPEDTYISYLPLPHIYEHGCYWYTIFIGMKVGIYSGDIKKLKDDLQALKPTFFPSVPRFFNKVYNAMQKRNI